MSRFHQRDGARQRAAVAGKQAAGKRIGVVGAAAGPMSGQLSEAAAAMPPAAPFRCNDALSSAAVMPVRLTRSPADSYAMYQPWRIGRSPSPTTTLRRAPGRRSEEHTSELQSLMRTSYAVFCLKKNNQNKLHRTM